MATAAPAPAEEARRIVLYDGVCAFCDAAVQWLIERDDEARLHFAPLQGRTAAELRARHPEIPEGLDTMVYVEREDDGEERVYLRFDATRRAWAAVEPGRPLVRLLSQLPLPLVNLGYWIFARLRYRLFGARDACRVPSPEQRARFLD